MHTLSRYAQESFTDGISTNPPNFAFVIMTRDAGNSINSPYSYAVGNFNNVFKYDIEFNLNRGSWSRYASIKFLYPPGTKHYVATNGTWCSVLSQATGDGILFLFQVDRARAFYSLSIT